MDLGLRDVGVKNHPRRHAAHLGKMAIQLFALIVPSVFAMCVIARSLGADAWIVAAIVPAWTTGVLVMGLRMAKRTPPVVVRVTAEGANQATWLLMAPCLFLVPAAVLTRDPLTIPLVVATAIMALLFWRGRGRVPEVLRKLRPLLAEDESVLGDGAGMVRGGRRWHDAFRLVVATDRRVLVATPTRSTEGVLLVDAPYERVSGFGIEWRFWGRIGVLSLTVAGVDGGPSETHIITSIAPANLLSIAQALESHGVHADDAVTVFEAERAWEDAQRRAESRVRLLDRAAMNSRDFDRGLWLLLGLSTVTFYVLPVHGVAPVVLAVPVLCGFSGYLSGTKASLAYIVPLNLLVSPTFLFADAGGVVGMMVLLSSLAALGLWAGVALREGTETPAGAAEPEPRPAPGSLRHALSGVRLIRITGVMLAVGVALVAIGGMVGIDRVTLRLAIDEAIAHQVPVDGRSNLTGGTASVTYTPGPDLHEFITDNAPEGHPTDGARWELRSSFTKGYNFVSLASYIEEPRLDNAAALTEFVERKDSEHSGLAGFPVSHTTLVVRGRRGYVWNHNSRNGYWYYAAWFPQPVNSVRIECIAKKQLTRFRRLCTEAIGSLKFQ